MAAFLIFTRPMEVISTARAGNGRRPRERAFSNVQAHFHKGEHCEHFRRYLRRQLTNGAPAGRPACRYRGVTFALNRLVCADWFFSSVKAGPGSIKKHAGDAMALRE